MQKIKGQLPTGRRRETFRLHRPTHAIDPTVKGDLRQYGETATVRAEL